MSTTPIDPQLRAFLADWLAWVERGAPEAEPYTRRRGLCSNAELFRGWDDAAAMALHWALVADFGAYQGLFPFGGPYAYVLSSRACDQHLNKQRLAWVRGKLEAS